MSRLFPHTAYAEDQPWAKTILTTHVLTRGVTTGTVVGGVLFGGRTLFSRMKTQKKPSSPTTATAPFMRQFLRSVGISTAWTLAFVGVGMVGRMWGRDNIEWKDRSWRLLENKGQLEVDDWTYVGMAVGLAASAVVLRRGKIPPVTAIGGQSAPAVTAPAAGGGGVQAAEVLGTVSLGSFAGMLGYMGWRYGVNGGKFPSD